MSNYSAVVVQIDNIRKHDGADRLQCTNVFGNNVIVGLDAKIGDVCLYFPLESQLGQEFAEVNDLIRRKDENGKPAGGMFDSNRRVRAQTLRGEKSMGFLAPISYLYKLVKERGDWDNLPLEIDGKTIFNVGDEFETIAGFEIAKKYIPPMKQQSQSVSKSGKMQKKAEKAKIVDNQFKFHFDTSHLGRNIHKIHPESLISITWKMHGSSFIVANLLTTKKLKWYEKMLKRIGVNIVDEHYDYVYASRKVIKGVESNIESRKDEQNHWYGFDLWEHVGRNHFLNKLHKGETVYGEVVGHTPNGRWIQANYDYGCKENEYDLYIYRITQTNADGVVTELPWHQVVHRAKEIGVKIVPEIYYGKAKDVQPVYPQHEDITMWQDQFLKRVQESYVYDQDCQFCNNKVPAEGIVVRCENGDGIENFKLKSFRFAQHESKQLDAGEVDMETEQSEVSE